MYDVFISYKSDNLEWVMTLRDNLEIHGLNTFLDVCSIQPGDLIATALEEGIKQSRCGIVVVTAEALTSSWVATEYEAMLSEQKARPEFRVIPLILGNSTALPFIKVLAAVDFRSHVPYVDAFRQLLGAISRSARVVNESRLKHPSAETRAVDLEGGSEKEHVELIFNRLDRDAILALAPDDRLAGPFVDSIVARIEHRYRDADIMSIAPMFSPESTLEEYFLSLGEQCSLDRSTSSPAQFERELRSRIRKNSRSVILINGIENGSPAWCYELAGVLRNLYQTDRRHLHMLFLGGRRLMEMAYAGNELSPLEFAMPLEWPDLVEHDVVSIMQLSSKDANCRDTARAILRVAGGHPRLVQICLDCYVASGVVDEEMMKQSITCHPYTRRLFAAFKGDIRVRSGVCKHLRRPEIGPAGTRLSNDLVSSLYWRNLICQRLEDGRPYLFWRCEALRVAGQLLLECECGD